MGDLYRSYLRDTTVLQNKHISALKSSSNDFINLFGENRTMSSNDFINLFGENRTMLPDIVPVDDAMGPY